MLTSVSVILSLLNQASHRINSFMYYIKYRVHFFLSNQEGCGLWLMVLFGIAYSDGDICILRYNISVGTYHLNHIRLGT